MKIGFTGTQQGMTNNQIMELHNILKDVLSIKNDEFHHGDCIGADEEAHDIAEELNIKIMIHPPISIYKRVFCITKLGIVYKEKDYLDRNKDIVNETGSLIAAPETLKEKLRSRTWSTIRYARKKGKRVYILEP